MQLDDKILSTLFLYLSNENIEGINAILYILLSILIYIETNYNSLSKDDNVNLYNIIKNTYYNKYYLCGVFDFEMSDKLILVINKLLDILDNVNINSINLWLFLDNVFDFCFRTQNLLITRELSKYYNNKYLTEWIISLANPNILTDTIFDGNIKVNSCMEYIIKNNQNITCTNRLFGHQQNNIMKQIYNTHFLLNTNVNFSKNISNDNLLINDIHQNVKYFDLIFFDFSSNIHNIIHANCCNKVKKLKLRGTKFEPLLLQLIMMSLTKNGRAILTVPDCLLFSDSMQHILTRKYLLENFNVKKIIQIDESFYNIKNNKNSILYFENNGPTNSINFYKISLNNNVVVENKITEINFNIIKTNQFSLYYKNYVSINNFINEIKYNKFNELYDISNSCNKSLCLCLSKYYKNDKSIQLLNEPITGFEYYITLKNNNSFYLLYLENIIKSKVEQFVKGQMNQFDINKLNNLNIPLLSESIQNSVCTYLNITKQLIKDNNDNISNYNKLKKCIIDTIETESFISINNICSIIDSNTDTNQNNIIGIIRNGLTAGTVYKLVDINKISNNSHYLVMKDNNFLYDYIFYYLKCNENKLKEIANLTTQPNLNKTSLYDFKIPIIELQHQLNIVSYCNDFDNLIKKCELDNKIIREKDIIDTIIKLNCK
jgi:hypothetical protein